MKWYCNCIVHRIWRCFPYTDLWPLCSVHSLVAEKKKCTFKSWECQCKRCAQSTPYKKLKSHTCIILFFKIPYYYVLPFKVAAEYVLTAGGNLGIKSDAPSCYSCLSVVMSAHHLLQFGFALLMELWTWFKGSYYG